MTFGQAKEIIMLDPDGVDNFGHFFAYNNHLRKACKKTNTSFSIFGNLRCDQDFVDKTPDFFRTFSIYSWTIGAYDISPDNEDLETFTNELRTALLLRDQRGRTHKTIIYMYCGSFPHILAVHNAIKDFPNVTACINTFYLSFMNYRTIQYYEQWASEIRDISQSGKILVQSPTQSTIDFIDQYYAISMQLAAHPSTTFEDNEFSLREDVDADSQQTSPRKILFPGGMLEIKGFDLTTKIVTKLHELELENIKCDVRCLLRPNTPQAQRRDLEALKLTEAHLSTQDMDSSQFANFLMSADVVVLPYKNPAFTERTSGLLIDAMKLGVPVVVCEGTWLAQIVQDYDASGICCSQDDADAFVTAILEIVHDYSKYKQQANEAFKAYEKENSWDFLVKQILETSKQNKSINSVTETTATRVLHSSSYDNIQDEDASESPDTMSWKDRLRQRNPSASRVFQFAEFIIQYLKRRIILSTLLLLACLFLLLGPVIFGLLLPFKFVFGWIAALIIISFIGVLSLAFVNMLTNRVAEREILARQALKQEILAEFSTHSIRHNEKLESVKASLSEPSPSIKMMERELYLLKRSMLLVADKSDLQNASADIADFKLSLSRIEKLHGSQIANQDTALRAEISDIESKIAKLHSDLDKNSKNNSSSSAIAQAQLEDRIKQQQDSLKSELTEALSKVANKSELENVAADIADVKSTLSHSEESYNALFADQEKALVVELSEVLSEIAKLHSDFEQKSKHNSSSSAIAQEQLEERIMRQLKLTNESIQKTTNEMGTAPSSVTDKLEGNKKTTEDKGNET